MFRNANHPVPSLQLNIGIIAACATSLKPLVSRALGLSTTDRYNSNSRYAYGSRSRGTPGTKRPVDATGSRHDRIATIQEFELEDELGRGSASRTAVLTNSKGETSSTATSFYKHGSTDGSGSEEMILSNSPPQQNFKGILRTTEVIVK